MDRQFNGQQKKDKRTDKGLLNIALIPKDRATRTPLKLGVKSGAQWDKHFLFHMYHPFCYK